MNSVNLNRVGFLLLLILLGKTSFSQENYSDPVEPYLKIAAENNPELKAKFNQYLAVLEQIPQAKTLPDPTLMFNIFISPIETRVGAQNAGISLNQAFPWFGQLGAQGDAAGFRAKARYESFQEEKNRLFFEVRSEYYDLYILEAAISIAEKNIVLLESLKELSNVRLESATGNAVDVLRVEMALEELINQLDYLRESRAPIQAKFKELLNSESSISIVLPDTLQTLSLERNRNSILDSILINNPILLGYDYQASSLSSEMIAARKMGLPSFNLGLTYINISPRTGVDIPDNGKDALVFPQIGVRIPLYRNKYKSMVREKELLMTSVEFERENQINQLETILEENWRDYTDAERRVKLYLRLIQYASQSLDILIARYTTAGSEFEEVLRMESQLLRYELELEKARSEQNRSVAFINYLTAKQF